MPAMRTAARPGKITALLLLIGLAASLHRLDADATQTGSGAPSNNSPSGLTPPPLRPGEPEPLSDPRDLSGTWHGEQFLRQINSDMAGQPIPFNDEGRKVLDRRLKAKAAGTPYVNASLVCRPPGPGWQFISTPFNVHQSRYMLEFAFFYFHGRWDVALDPAKAAPSNEYQGRAMGHWEGDTLVVKVNDFKDRMWLDFNGTPASKDAVITMRIQKLHSDHWYLQIVYTLDDPKYYTRQWSYEGSYAWRPDETLYGEYNCEDQIGGKDSIATAGSIVEPQD
jgi:hypothetical protein